MGRKSALGQVDLDTVDPLAAECVTQPVASLSFMSFCRDVQDRSSLAPLVTDDSLAQER